MRHLLPLVLGLVLLASVSRGNPAATTQPARSARNALLILPFLVRGDAKYNWISTGLQQELATALAPNLRGPATAPSDAPAVNDASQAIAAGRRFDATVVLFGQAQVMGQETRLSGSVVEVPTGRALGSLNQTGPTDHFFSLEDALAKQALGQLPTEVLNFRGIAASRQLNPPRVIQLPGDAPTEGINNGPIDGGPSVANSAYQLAPPPGYATPYSPNAGTYPWRFSTPYSHLFTYDFDPDPFLPGYPGFYPWQHHRRGDGRPGRR